MSSDETKEYFINAFTNLFSRNSPEVKAHIVALFKNEADMGNDIPVLGEEPDKVAEKLKRAWNLSDDEVNKAIPKKFFMTPNEAQDVFVRFMNLQPAILDANENHVMLSSLGKAIRSGKIDVADREKKLEALDKYADDVKLLELSCMEEGAFDETIGAFKSAIESAEGDPGREAEFEAQFNKSVSEASKMISTVELLLGDRDVKRYTSMFQHQFRDAKKVIDHGKRTVHELHATGNAAKLQSYLIFAHQMKRGIWEHGPASMLHLATAYGEVLEHAHREYGLRPPTLKRVARK